MNTFYEHHKDSIRFGYRCFDRILLNGLIQPFQQPERVVGFFRQLPAGLSGQPRGAARRQFQGWVKERAEKASIHPKQPRGTKGGDNKIDRRREPKVRIHLPLAESRANFRPCRRRSGTQGREGHLGRKCRRFSSPEGDAATRVRLARSPSLSLIS